MTLSDGEEGLAAGAAAAGAGHRFDVVALSAMPGRSSSPSGNSRDSGKSDTLRHQSLEVQVVSQPAWYAVMAMPYLMEFPHECAEQTFHRYYANALGRHLVQSDPKIRRVFELWRGTDALDSPLTKNQDLKGILLEETPWLQEPPKTSRRPAGGWACCSRTTKWMSNSPPPWPSLTGMQGQSGLWPWFDGGPGLRVHFALDRRRFR